MKWRGEESGDRPCAAENTQQLSSTVQCDLLESTTSARKDAVAAAKEQVRLRPTTLPACLPRLDCLCFYRHVPLNSGFLLRWEHWRGKEEGCGAMTRRPGPRGRSACFRSLRVPGPHSCEQRRMAPK